MAYRNLLVSLVTALALVALAAQSVSAFGVIEKVEVNGVGSSGINIANFAGQSVPILVVFRADQAAEDVRIKAWITGSGSYSVVSERFDVLPGRIYTKIIVLEIPSDLDDETYEPRELEVVVEDREHGVADSETVTFTVQRESYLIDILGVTMNPEVKAGETLVLDVVLKNRGSQFAEDNFVRVRIPELGIETGSYFGDLSAVDQGGNVPDKEDAAQGRLTVRIPASAAPGVYNVQIEALNSDSVARLDRKVSVLSSSADTRVVASTNSQNFAVGEKGEFKLTLVNRGNNVGVYDIATTSAGGLNLQVSDPVVVVPAGATRTVSIFADSATAGDYTFGVSIRSEDGRSIEDKTFSATVGGTASAGSANTTVLLTVVLAIVFVVLLVVLIVLLTRKTEKSEEFGESYY